METDRTPTGQKEPSRTNSYIKYSGFAFQLLGGIGLAAWAGYRLDKYVDFKFPIFTLSFVMLVFGGMLYLMYKKLKQE